MCGFAFAGSLATAKAVLGRWPHLDQLACARRASLTAVVAEHTRSVADVPDRVEQIRSAAGDWAQFWAGRLDLDALAWEVSEHLADLAAGNDRVDRAADQATMYWERLYGDDALLVSLPGMGPVTAPAVRAFLGDGSRFDTAKAVANYVGITPSNWSSGTVNQPSRAITKEGPAALRAGWPGSRTCPRTPVGRTPAPPGSRSRTRPIHRRPHPPGRPRPARRR